MIHENADVKAAELFWLEATGTKPEQFLTPTLKRHNPKTVRKNVGETITAASASTSAAAQAYTARSRAGLKRSRAAAERPR